MQFEGPVAQEHFTDPPKESQSRYYRRSIPFGPYQLLERIGQGGMAEVFRARRQHMPGLARFVALKRILPAFSAQPRATRMFITEARVMALLNHGNIIQAYDFGIINGCPYMAMELVDGHDLRHVRQTLRARGHGIPIPVAIHAAIAVSRALAYAHSRADPLGRPLGIVHRDISLGNIMLGFDGQVKLADFGVARIADCPDDTGRLIKGKYTYMSPEQIRGRRVDGRSDLFSLGIVLYELVTGRRPFEMSTPTDTMRQVLVGRVVPASKINPRVSPALDAVIVRALERRPSNRYQLAEDIGADLQQVAQREGFVVRTRVLAQWIHRVLGRPWTCDSLHAAAQLHRCHPWQDKAPTADDDEATAVVAGRERNASRTATDDAAASVVTGPPAPSLHTRGAPEERAPGPALGPVRSQSDYPTSTATLWRRIVAVLG